MTGANGMSTWPRDQLERIGASEELQLAFYAGWPRAMSAITLARELFTGAGDQ